MTTDLSTLWVLLQIPAALFLSASAIASEPIVAPSLVFAERDGIVAVEAEHFFEQDRTDKRAFCLTTADQKPGIKPDGDPSHVAGASGGAYLEILPDTRRTHSDRLVKGENFSPQPGALAVLKYKVHFTTTGRYYVWVRAHSTGTEDNGLHVGLDGKWPETGQRMQWCAGKRTWRWESKQRTPKQHCGEPYKIYLDIDEPGQHIIQFSMREDGFEFDKWIMTTEREFARPDGVGPASGVHAGELIKSFAFVSPKPEPPAKTRVNNPDADSNALSLTRQSANDPRGVPNSRRTSTSPTTPVSDKPLIQPRKANGDGTVEVSGERKTWHKVTLSLDGPYAHEQDNAPNPFTDYRMTVEFTHPSGKSYVVPGYFAADGNAANSSAESGTRWRAHFAPNEVGTWNYVVRFHRGSLAALDSTADAEAFPPYDGISGTIDVAPTDKQGRDLRAHGRLQYVGKHYPRFAGSKQYFLKAGADAPETLLGYKDFDNTVAMKGGRVPLKTWAPHLQDWNEGDPSWKDGRGKGLIGAINYLSGKGCNAFSFLTYNAGGDGDNVWPFIHRDDKLHYDCSKLDQWGIVFDHGTAKGMYLHFKMQETENDDHTIGKGKGYVPECLDGGNLGPQRKLYCRELVARYGHNLALNWNLGEENTQTTAQQQAMIDYLREVDPYDHHIVIHTYPQQHAKVYGPLLGGASKLTGVSLQNSSLKKTHADTLRWVQASAKAGKPWIVAFDESGSAAHAQCPDLGYRGFDGHDSSGKYTHTQHEVRKYTLWGTLMAGGVGNEYYFGYKFVENDLVCEDWRSRDQSWDYCRIALEFFRDHEVPFWEMVNADELVGNLDHDDSKYCFAKPNKLYLVYLPDGGTTTLNLENVRGDFNIAWFNPRSGGELKTGSVTSVTGGDKVQLGNPPGDDDEDWLVVVRRKSAQAGRP